MTSYKFAPTPVDTKGKLGASSEPSCQDPTLYCSPAGALLYLSFTRPDISYAVQQVCLHIHDSKNDHMTTLKRILRYIQVLLIMAYIFTSLQLWILSLIQMRIGMDARIQDNLPPTIVFSLRTS